MARIKDMTSGNPVKLILFFALPVLAGNMLQQLYSLVDSLIIGQLLGVRSLTAVSASGWLDWAVLTVALEVTSQMLLRPVLTWMNSPAETIDLTENYLRIIYAGLPVVMCLNVFSGFLHALGNSRTPLLALACSTAVNIALDWWFVGSLGLGTNGGAYATVIAQVVSASICLAAVLKIQVLRPQRSDYRPDRRVIRKLTRLGFPIAFQHLIISLGGLVLQGVVNAFGFVFMAGYNAASRLQGLVEIAGSSLGNAAGTFTGQNFGARRMDRIKLGLRRSAQIAFLLALVVGGLMILLGKPILSLFIRDEAALAEQVLAIGYDFLRVMAAGLPMLYLLFIYRTTLQGLGDTMMPMASGFLELVLRIGAALLLPALLGYWGVYLAEIAAWVGAGVFLIIACYHRLHTLINATEKKI